MEKSRRRREAAGKVPRRRKSMIVSGHRPAAGSVSSSQDAHIHTHPNAHPYQAIESETVAGTEQRLGDGEALSHDQQRLPWALHVLQTASVHPLPPHSQAGAISGDAGGIGQNLPPNGISDREFVSLRMHRKVSDDPGHALVEHLHIHPQLRPQQQSIGANIHPTATANNQSHSTGILNPGAGEMQSIDGLHQQHPGMMANHIMHQVDGSGNDDALALTSPPLAPLDFSPPRPSNSTYVVPQPHPQTAIAAPARIRTASEVETESRAAIWTNHHTSLYELKESVESLLATLWARDTDPRELEAMFEALNEEVKRTKERLVVG
ncbi:hypothetical protein QFC22_004896 [Naganishia vaughanmartiniae]|uniref:Uncharacterized protein n=1 Tax=Naganishia vaughanmartiniae TaxID=1424756 RepID=A0ACC2WXL1_9TREE|nr:hypothetical protein QFC22_004896 [Naganishia vaughanmartiniae]